VVRKIVTYKKYFLDFYEKQNLRVQEKIEHAFDMVRFEQRVPKSFLKYLTGSDGIFEIKVKTKEANVRIFCFFDKGNLVVLVNSFAKKTQKTPRREIKLAERLKKEYLEERYGKGK
jgi:phage-related protein